MDNNDKNGFRISGKFICELPLTFSIVLLMINNLSYYLINYHICDCYKNYVIVIHYDYYHYKFACYYLLQRT